MIRHKMRNPATTETADTLTLSYVNTREHTKYLDTLFTSYDEIAWWVADTFPEYTSYQVLVTRARSAIAHVAQPASHRSITEN